MEREKLVRDDFPTSSVDGGYDKRSVDAHQAAVAAHVAALEARISALEVELNTLRDQLADARDHEEGPSGLPEPGPDPLEHLPKEEVQESASPAQNENEVAARLFVSKLAMEGKGRDSIVMQLAAEHEIADPGALVDDVLARLG